MSDFSDRPADFPEVTSFIDYTTLRRNPDVLLKELYNKAKNHEDREAAAEFINRLMTDDDIKQIQIIAAKQ